MCQSHTIHHLCGHIKVKTIVQCPELTDSLVKEALAHKKATINGYIVPFTEFADQTKLDHQLCTEVADDVHIFPDMCEECKSTGVIGDYMAQDPGAKLSVLRSWRSRRRLAIITAPQESQPEVQSTDTDSTDGSDHETLEYIPVPVGSKALTASPKSESQGSDMVSTASSATSNKSAVADLSTLKARLDRLKGRTEQLLAKIRAHNIDAKTSSSGHPT